MDGVGLAFSGPSLLCLAIVSFFGGHNSGPASMATAVSAAAATTGVRGGIGLCCCAVTKATAVSAAAATAGVRGEIGLCCCAVTMATAVNAGAATAGSAGAATAGGQRWRSFVLLCSHHGNSCQCWSCNSWDQRWRRVMLLCSFREYISYRSSSDVGVLEYVYGQ